MCEGGGGLGCEAGLSVAKQGALDLIELHRPCVLQRTPGHTVLEKAAGDEHIDPFDGAARLET